MTDRLEDARTLGWIAQDLDSRGYPYAGFIRQKARDLLDGPTTNDGGCVGCGGELVQPWTGRRRIWCSERCRRRKRP